MKTVEIVSDFDGYPNGKDKRRFTAGEEPELSNEFADLIIGKRLAREKGAKPLAKADAPKPTTEQKPAAGADGKTEDSK